MKKKIFIVLMLFIFSNLSAYAMDAKIIELRNKFFEESKQIKSLLGNSKDVVLLTGMVDACLLTVSQIDAYTYMMGIFNTIKDTGINEEAFKYLTEWLVLMRSTSSLNIKSFDAVVNPVEPSTKPHMAILRDYFANLNKKIDSELSRFVRIKSLLKTNR
jgi:hypothetical protein